MRLMRLLTYSLTRPLLAEPRDNKSLPKEEMSERIEFELREFKDWLPVIFWFRSVLKEGRQSCPQVKTKSNAASVGEGLLLFRIAQLF